MPGACRCPQISCCCKLCENASRGTPPPPHPPCPPLGLVTAHLHLGDIQSSVTSLDIIFIEIYFTCYKIHLLKVYSSADLSVFIKLYNCHHNLILEHFLSPRIENLSPPAVMSPSLPQHLVATAPPSTRPGRSTYGDPARCGLCDRRLPPHCGSRFICVVVTSFLCRLNTVPLCGWSELCLSVHLGGFRLLAAVNIRVQGLVRTRVSHPPGRYLGVDGWVARHL